MLRLIGKKTSATDDQLLVRYKKSGDSAALGSLFQRYLHKVMGICLYYLKDETASEDAVMEIFEQVIEKVHQYEIQNFESWIGQVTRNHCIRELRNRFSVKNVDINEINEEFFMESEPDSDPIIREQQFDALSEAIQSLKKAQRECIVLFFIKGLTYREIEQATSYQLTEIKSHIQNGKRNLKNMLIDSLRPGN